MLKPVIRFRKHILLLYTFILALLLLLPLPQNLHITPLQSLAMHFMLFFGLYVAAELAHLFKGRHYAFRYAVMLAVMLEAIHAFLPYRQFDLIDLSANVAGVLCANFAISFYRSHPLVRLIQGHGRAH
ncbi:MAG: hypothetical protein N3H30_02215 [Candidatus Micrarchaeota archaeon]|nr:hypothetical protein [Candidatus Micrarchaeota archaeon]